MKALGLRSLIYSTDNIERDTAWWSEALGKKPYFEAEEYVGFDIEGYEIGLFVAPEPFPESGITYIGVEDVEATYNELLESGCVSHEKPVDVGGGISMASVKNQQNQIIGFIHNPNFKK